MFFFPYNVPDFHISEHLPTNIFNSDAGKYYTNPKDTIFLTLILVNKFAKFRFLIEEETIFLCLSLFVYLFFYLLFLDKKEKMHCITYLYLTVIIHRLNMQLRKTILKERKITTHKETINKSTKIIKYF